MKPDVLKQLIRSAVVLACLVSFSPVSTLGQQQRAPSLRLNGLLGTGTVDAALGVTGGIGMAWGSTIYLLRTSFDIHLLKPEDSEYSWDFGSDGPECRVTGSGTVVNESRCVIDRALAGISADASMIMPAFRGGIHLGAGYAMAGSTAYGLVGYAFNPHDRDMNLLFRLVAGRELLGIQAIASLPIYFR